jgi:hypothetical protein|tara:strand:- start:190 stop:816 length:627 start_codon:yes stop_codon:yes gene_type:complete
MKKALLITALTLLSQINLAQTTPGFNVGNNSFKVIDGSGDVVMRRFGSGDLTWKLAFVVTEPTLNINYASHFSEGVRVRGSKLVVDGKLGIGTQNPDEKLTVKGKIHAEEVRVDLNVPADYVFQKYYTGASLLKETYKMPTLEEVAAFTKKNHHLPEVPSAAQIQKEGLHLKQMTNLLLQKIEELTIYTIEQEKRINALESKLVGKKS